MKPEKAHAVNVVAQQGERISESRASEALPDAELAAGATPLAESLVDSGAVEEVLRAARQLFEEGCSWPKFYQEILGPDGLIARLFPTPEAQTEFRRSRAYGEIQRMLAALSRRRLRRRRAEQPVKIITVRVPESVHAELAREAAARGTSVNQLCIMKLVQLLEAEALAANSESSPSAAASSEASAELGASSEEASRALAPETDGGLTSGDVPG